mmetsp:Transcript_35258/g.65322  ORF Transcript_35258/g.65322 Transcript_35258/m.65322 type:complete len:86 (-) Transcript_35258:148-405(-)
MNEWASIMHHFLRLCANGLAAPYSCLVLPPAHKPWNTHRIHRITHHAIINATTHSSIQHTTQPSRIKVRMTYCYYKKNTIASLMC